MSVNIDPRITRTRGMFGDALLKLMEEKDYNNISVQEIAEQSTLHRATFYLHFVDKDDLLKMLLDNAVLELKNCIQIKKSEDTSNHDYFQLVITRLFDKIAERFSFYQKVLAKEKFSYFTELVRRFIQEFIKDELLYPGKDKIECKVPGDMSTVYFSSAYIGVIIWWLNNDMPHQPNYMAIQLTKMSRPYTD